MNEVQVEIQKLTESLWVKIANLYSIWTLYQIAIILACYVAALGIAALLEPPIEARLRKIEQQPQLLRFLAVLLRRLKWFIFPALLWGSAAIIRELTWPSRSYFIVMAASLAVTWVTVSVLSRLFRNRSLARIIALCAWTVAALYIIGWLDPTVKFLDWAAVSFGNVRISLFTVLKGLSVLLVLLWIGKIIGNLIERQAKGSDLLNPSMQVLLSQLAKTLIFIVAATAALSAAGLDLTLLTVFSGALGLGLGFGLQKVMSNLASGFIMLLDRSIKPGDVIELGDTFGWITSIHARYVSAVTRDGAEYLIPNEHFITERVVNWSYTNRKIRLEVKFGVDYASDPHLVRKVVGEAIRGIPRVLDEPAPVCHLVAFGDSSLDFVVRFWIYDPEGGITNIQGAALLAIWDVLKLNNIAIPYPHMTLLRRAQHLPEDRSTDTRPAGKIEEAKPS
ncbi:MAG TPA: mechanosensitive ion channel domain-containing protein [Hyphomicrobiales bacterium]|nr:mechanosensitive ion channel domain-containing protein [Hyphomicrobiales bacterium]